MEWRKGGLLWSLNRLAKRDVDEHFAKNPLARRARYSLRHRLLRGFFSIRTFGAFLGIYLLLDFGALDIELWAKILDAGAGPEWASGPAAHELLTTVPSYLASTQVGMLGVISLALALVTLIAQRDEAAMDVQVYYHESLFFEIAASSIALTAILVAQFVWPLQMIYHWLAGGVPSASIQLGLMSVHIIWLLINLIAIAHFIGVTFHFVQRSAREALREAYTANVIVPQEMLGGVREGLYTMAGLGAVSEEDGINPALFGMPMSEPYEVEISAQFRHPARLSNVLIRPAHWAIARWYKRCGFPRDPHAVSAFPAVTEPRLWIAPRLDQTLNGEIDWCRRHGGLPLDPIERFALRLSFRFSRARNAE